MRMQCLIRAATLVGGVALFGVLGACAEDLEDPQPEAPTLDGDMPYENLSEYNFFRRPMSSLEPLRGVIPFEPASPLWSDFSVKSRFFVLPEGEKISFGEEELWGWPEGTIIIKNFALPLDRRDLAGEVKIVETRLLVHNGFDWDVETYIWNDDQTDAERIIAGARVTLDVIDTDGQPVEQVYPVPNLDQCNSCHERGDEMRTLGPVTGQLNTTVFRDGLAVNQLEWLEAQGVFDDELPPVETLDSVPDPADDSVDVELRARAWLHANCAHCHREGGGGGASGLTLTYWEEDDFDRGICKPSVAAGAGTGGFRYDIVPGNPDESILVFRVNSLDPEVKMPELPNRIIDQFGLSLLRDWISSMPADDCASNQ